MEMLMHDFLFCKLPKKDAEQITIINEPKRREFGAPDFELRKGVMVISFLETKDVDDTDLRGTRLSMNKQQFDRYKAAISTIAFTNFREFVLYENGKETASACIAHLDDNQITMTADEQQLSAFTDLMLRLLKAEPQPIKSATELAQVMAGKAQLMARLIEQHLKQHPTFTYDEEWDDPSDIRGQFETFRMHLINGLSEKAFADIYAQTITYGLFAARLHTKTPQTFSRAEVPWFIPQTNPFLRSIFSIIAGADLDKNIAWIVDDLTKAFRYADVKQVMRHRYAAYKHYDPLLHFYEDFLAAYDPKARKDNGVWYTPQGIVSYMVSAVDEVLQRDFSLSDGLANRDAVEHDGRVYHRVQILDPATGTGTFLSEIIQLIHDRIQPGLWQQYVENDLLPRLNGFEILMASYAVAHLKLDLTLQDTGYSERSHQRLRIFLTNSLENKEMEPISLFDYKLARESNQARSIKQRYPVMVMIGNPPYNNSSHNNDKWIQGLIRQYKEGLTDKKLNLDDDYVKFIRLGQHYIEKNHEGVLAFITNNNYLDAVTFRQMRRSLLKSFDDIYILNLHGNVKNREMTPDGEKDENVFNIMQGVCIGIFVKTTKSDEPARVHYYGDVYGKRRSKLQFLSSNSLLTTPWADVTPVAPYYFLMPKDFSKQEDYEKGFRIDELFVHYNSGIQTKRDELNVFFTDDERKAVLRDFQKGDLLELHRKYKLHDSSGWNLERAIADIQSNPIVTTKIAYRPFDVRFVNYTGKTSGMMGRPRQETNEHLIDKDNLALLTCKQQSSFPFQHVFATRIISDLNSISAQSKEQTYVFPLYIYNKEGERIANLREEVAGRIDADAQTIFDYVYAVLHSSCYRKNYRELLRLDFPRVPYPKSAEQLRSLASLGASLRGLHLMETIPADINKLGVTYLGTGNSEVKTAEWRDDAVWINNENCFQGVAREVWNHYIGGYQPMQKWLQYRMGRKLLLEEIVHYERMAYAIRESINLIKKLDELEI
ncbi:MAG: N-6 DNA methylase [Prevotella sp.]|nr:N-6 DNA methylase [Prevotella sp.]